MSATLDSQRRRAIRARAIRYVRSKFGNVADLPGEVISVVWVTAFRGIETAVAVEEAGGQSGLLKNTLLGEGSLGRDLEVATEKMTLLIRMISIIRSATSHAEQAADCSLLVDILKWGTVDAADMSITDRVRARSLAKADDEYRAAVPIELTRVDDAEQESSSAVEQGGIVKWMKSVFRSVATPPKSSTGSPEADAIFQKLDRFLSDERAQNSQLPVAVRSEIEGGLSCDAIPGAVGEFGRNYQNPIPVNGPVGEILYLSNIRTMNQIPIMFHRIGSREGIDGFECVSLDGKVWDIFFLSLYHPRKSRRAPSGYRIAQGDSRRALFMGTNQFVDGFPRHIQDAVRDAHQQWLGVPMRSPELRRALEQVSFDRTKEHYDLLRETLASLDIKEM